MVFYGLMVLLMLSCVLMIMTTFTLFGLTTYCAAQPKKQLQNSFNFVKRVCTYSLST